MKKLKEIKISGISLPLYAFFMIVLAVTIGLGKLPLNMVGITLLLVLLGHLLYFIGEKLPIMNSYLGGGSVFTLLGATLLSFFHIIPANVIDAVGKFMGGQFGFLDFYIAALICGNEQKFACQSFGEIYPCCFGHNGRWFLRCWWYGCLAWQWFCRLCHVCFNAYDVWWYGSRNYTFITNLC